MIVISEDIVQIFEEVHHEISKNVRSLMEELWSNWTHLGVNEDTKIQNIEKLVQIEKDFHKDVISETAYKLKQLEQEIIKLKDETEELSRCLSVDITIVEFKEDMVVIEYKRALEEQLSVYRVQAEQRRKKMDRLLEWQRDLVDKLGVTMHELQEEPLPAEEELDKLKGHLEVLQAERDKRVELFLNTQVEIKDIMAKLHIKPQSKFEQMAVTSMSVDFKVTDQNMDRLAMLRQDLQERYEQTNNRVLELRERLTRLWDCLEEDQVYRENFLQAHTGCHPDTEAAIKEEIKRCDQIKRQKISVFVANVRTKIKLMWDNIMYSQEQREEFVHYYQDIFTEDTLTLHELYLCKITKFYEENRNIFDLVVTRKDLWLKMTELEARASVPNRYQNRGGQLLQEEKERKAISNKLPKIEQQIRDLVLKYEARTDSVFTVDGKPLLQMMEDDWETRKAERQNKLSARKQAQALLTPTTPLLRSLATSPLGKRNRTAAGLAHTADRHKPPSKRQLITSSATKAVGAITANISAFKRSAVTTVKRRISGRLAAKALVDNKSDRAKRKLDYDVNKKTPQPKANGSILKHKRTSRSGRRRSSTVNASGCSRDTECSDKHPPLHKDPLQDKDTTTYSDFKEVINERQISRSSMATNHETNPPRVKIFVACDEKPETPNRLRTNAPSTPKPGKENLQHAKPPMTPQSNLMSTPTRLTRSALKLNDGFATPRAPLSCSKANMHRQNAATNLTTTPNGMGRSNSHLNMMRTKNLPPIM